MLNFHAARMKHLPRRPDDVWQVALRRVPAWARDGSKYVRPEMVLCLGQRSGVEIINSDETGRIAPARLLDVVVAKALSPSSGGFLPGRVEVATDEHSRLLMPTLEAVGVPLVVNPDLSLIDAALSHLDRELNSLPGPPIPGILRQQGMSLDRVRAFADAAAVFYRAKPWKWTLGEPLFRIDPAPADPAFASCVAIGRAGECEGLAFFSGVEQAEEMDVSMLAADFTTRCWSVLFAELPELPLADADLWLDHDLPVASRRAHPFMVGARGPADIDRPGPELLTFAESVLRAFAAGKKKGIDAGGWTAQVPTFDGPRTVSFTLLERPRRAGFPAEPLDAEAAELLGFLSRRGIDVQSVLEQLARADLPPPAKPAGRAPREGGGRVRNAPRSSTPARRSKK